VGPEEVPSAVEPGFHDPVFEWVVDRDHAARACNALARESRLALDIETSSNSAPRSRDDKPALDPFRNSIRLVQLVGAGTPIYLFDLFRLSHVPTCLLSLLGQATMEFVGFNISFDAKQILHHLGVALARPVDLYTAAVLAEGYAGYREDGRFTLAAVVRRYLGLEVDKEQQLSDWSRHELTTAQLQYAARDVAVLLPLHDRLSAAAERAGVAYAWDVENRVIVPLASVELGGIRVDQSRIKKLVRIWRKQALQAGARAIAGLGEVDLDSPEQLRRAFASRLGISLQSTDESNLNDLAGGSPIAAAVLEYRQLSKRGATYGQTWLDAAKHDGRIHASFRSLGAPTGRMSCSGPNIQAVPRDPAARACFVPAPGHVFVVADCVAIELRVIAQLIGDRELRRCFCSSPAVDPHTRTAAFVLAKPLTDVTKEERNRAKPINFGFSFSLGAERFVAYARDEYGLAFTLRESVRLRQRFFGLYRGIAAWHHKAKYQGRRRMQVRTGSGRLRVFDEFDLGEYLNTPIQGSAADGMKRSLAILHPRLALLGAQIVNVIHDEIIVEAPADRAGDVMATVNKSMVAGMREFLPDVPVVVEVGIARSWKKL
jgi:DNA polymerase-1